MLDGYRHAVAEEPCYVHYVRKAMTKDAQAPAKPLISDTQATMIVLALENLESRMDALDQSIADNGVADIDSRLAEAQHKHADMVKAMKATRLEEAVARHEDRGDAREVDEYSDNSDSGDVGDDRGKYGLHRSPTLLLRCL
jgi:hypothetical protein